MNDETQSTVAKEPAGPLAGQRLAAARREREISIHDISKELHLDEPKVQALEENRFEVLGAPVFAKGHLRKYAELVGVPVDDVLADYYAMNRSVGAPPVVGAPRQRQREIRPGRWIAGILLLAAMAAAAYWWLNRDVPATPGAARNEPMSSPSTLESVTLPAGDVATDDASSSLDSSQPALSESEPSPATTADLLPAAPPEAGDDVADRAPGEQVVNRSLPSTGGPQVALGMTFSGDCWTEVTDANGDRLFFDLGRDGRLVTVSGEAPLRVLFGNAENVSITVDGNDYVIRESMRRGETARFTINAQ